MAMKKNIQKTASTVEQDSLADKVVSPIGDDQVAKVNEDDFVANPQIVSNSDHFDAARKVSLVLINAGHSEQVVSLSSSLWQKMCPEADITVIAAVDYYSAIVEVIASDQIHSQVVLVPVLTVPVSEVSLSDLTVLKSFAPTESRNAELRKIAELTGLISSHPTYIPRELPMAYDKLKLAEIIAKFDLSDDSICIPTLYAQIVHPSCIAFDASVGTSRITGLVSRLNPRMDVVCDYTQNRKFIVTNSDGFDAIKVPLSDLLSC